LINTCNKSISLTYCLCFCIFIQDFKLATEFLSAVEKEARNSSVNSGTLYKLVRLLSWETLLIQIIEFLTEWPNHKLSKSNILIYIQHLSMNSVQSISFFSRSLLFIPPKFMSQFIEFTLILQLHINQLNHFSSSLPRFCMSKICHTFIC
jgi:hypothetical protein